MSLPKQYLPGAVYHVVRRTCRGEARITPSEAIRNAAGVVVASANQATGVRVLATSWMPTHQHTVLEDVEGRLPEWLARVHGTMARFMNATQGKCGKVWNGDAANCHELLDHDAIANAIVYTIIQPVKDGWVYEPSAWPGLSTTPEQFATGSSERFMRPQAFFARNSPVVAVTAINCRVSNEIGGQALKREVLARLEIALAKHRRNDNGTRRKFRGSLRAEKLSPEHRTGAAKPVLPRPYRTFVASTIVRLQAKVAQYQEFLNDYAKMRRRRAIGFLCAVFPIGTWQLWRYQGALRAPPTRGLALAEE